MKKLILLFVGITVMMISCSKDDDKHNSSGTTPTPVKTNYVVRIDNKDSSYTKISYTGSNVTKVENYRANGLLDDYLTIEYNGNKLSKVATYNGDGNILNEFIYSYISFSKPDLVNYVEDGDTAKILFKYENDKIRAWEYSVPSDSNPDSSYIYAKVTFTWIGNNIEKIEYYELKNNVLKLIETTVYEYDTKRNPFNGSMFYFAILNEDILKMVCSENNVTKLTLTDSSGTIENYNSYKYIIEYNENNDISKKIEINFQNDTTEVETYMYQSW